MSEITEEYVKQEYASDIAKAYGYLVSVAEDHKLTADDIPKLTMAAVKIVEKIKKITKLKKPQKGQVKRVLAIILVQMFIEDHCQDSHDDSLKSQIISVLMKTLPILIDTIVDAITGNFSIGKTIGRCGTAFGCIRSHEPRYI